MSVSTLPTGFQTVQRFLSSPDIADDLGQSMLALRVKATIFFEMAARLSRTRGKPSIFTLHLKGY